jgi:biotin transport system substrate-specific component
VDISRLRLLVLAALLAALTAVCSLLALPNPLVPGVPFTLQVLAVCLAGMLLPPRWAAASQIVYVLLGAIGLPVFAGGGAGVGVLVSVTGGFLWGYPFAAAACAAIAGRGGWARLVLGGIAAIVVIYAFGFAGMVVFGHVRPDLASALGLGSFLPWDLAKAVIAAALAVRLRAALRGTVAA